MFASQGEVNHETKQCGSDIKFGLGARLRKSGESSARVAFCGSLINNMGEFRGALINKTWLVNQPLLGKKGQVQTSL